MYGLVNEASVLAAAPDRGTILSSRVDPSKGTVRNVLASDLRLNSLIVSKVQHELSAFYSMILGVDGM